MARLRDVAITLDALVQTRKASRESATTELAHELTLKWREVPDGQLDIGPGQLSSEGADLLEGTRAGGAWLLPAYMAGLRAIRVLPHCGQEELIFFATALADLEPEVVPLRHFSDWMWADGAEGFELDLDDSFAAGLDTAFVDIDEARKELTEGRVAASVAMTEQALALATGQVDGDVGPDECQGPLDMLAKKVARDEIQLGPDDVAALRAAAEDPLYWAEAEVDTVLDNEGLRAVLKAGKLARRVGGMMGRAADLSALKLLATMGQRKDPYSRSLQDGLMSGPLGNNLAQELPLTGASIKALHEVLQDPALESIAAGLLSGLLERAHRDKRVARALVNVAMATGVDSFLQSLELNTLSAGAARVACWLLLCVKAPGRQLGEMISGLGSDAAVAVLVQLPEAHLENMTPQLRQTLLNASGSQRHELVGALLKQEDPRWLKLLGEALAESGGSGWLERTVVTVGLHLARRKLARSYLVPMVRSNEVDPAVRVALIRTLKKGGTRRALSEAVKFGLQEMLYPAAVRDAMKLARKQLQDEEAE